LANYIFQKISKEGKAAGLDIGRRRTEASDWFRDRASEVSSVSAPKLMNDRERMYRGIGAGDIGRMFHFFYDPKHKKTLPYYDKFPLIFPFELTNKGYKGINLHYLPPLLRARLMDALYDVEMDDTSRESKKLQITYDLLKGVAKFKYFQPTIHEYLNSHVRSRFLYIPYEEWDIALFLPTERFAKKTKRVVWSESRKAIRGYNRL
jgi:hypothetical protein